MENVSVGDIVFVNLPFLRITGCYPVIGVEKGLIIVNVDNEINLWLIPNCYTLVKKAEKPGYGQLNPFVSEG